MNTKPASVRCSVRCLAQRPARKTSAFRVICPPADERIASVSFLGGHTLQWAEIEHPRTLGEAMSHFAYPALGVKAGVSRENFLPPVVNHALKQNTCSTPISVLTYVKIGRRGASLLHQ